MDGGSGSGPRGTFSRWLLKPADPSAPSRRSPKDRSVAELQHEYRYADDRERLVGLMAAPVGAALALLVVNVQLAHDPAVGLKGHVSVALYHELLVLLVVLSLGMLVAAWFRKRTILGVSAALYGLAVFNLHYWGFGVPFVMVGAWVLVRSFRAQRDLREATAAVPAGSGRPDGRYTPRSASRRRKPAAVKGHGGRRAG